LSWTQADWLTGRQVGYWGDIDTWGLQFLAKARLAAPHLESILMDSETFDSHRDSAVAEPIRADSKVPEGLDPQESTLYHRLLGERLGRLEQEFLSPQVVHRNLMAWSGRA
jgi:hypothetical protein